MLGMPVATLRVWERRYGLTAAALSPGGQRLYSAEDVKRLALLKQLTGLGHAIGRLAALDLAQLRGVAATHAQARAAAPATARTAPSAAWRLVVVGEALATRLQRPALLRRLGRAVELFGSYADLAQASAALAGQPPADVWLVHQPQLQADWAAALAAAQPGPARVAVLYGYAPEAVCEALADRGVALLREPQPDVVLVQWLQALQALPAALSRPAAPATAGAAPRRWSDAALAEFAAASTTVACECPRHVAELLVQLSRFEAYSAQCARRSPADAALHDFLGRVAGDARTRFEAALEQVALHDGLLLPPGAA